MLFSCGLVELVMTMPVSRSGRSDNGRDADVRIAKKNDLGVRFGNGLDATDQAINRASRQSNANSVPRT